MRHYNNDSDATSPATAPNSAAFHSGLAELAERAPAWARPRASRAPAQAQPRRPGYSNAEREARGPRRERWLPRAAVVITSVIVVSHRVTVNNTCKSGFCSTLSSAKSATLHPGATTTAATTTTTMLWKAAACYVHPRLLQDPRQPCLKGAPHTEEDAHVPDTGKGTTERSALGRRACESNPRGGR